MLKNENSITINKKIYVALFLLIFTVLLSLLLYVTQRNIKYMRIQREIYGDFVIQASASIVQKELTDTISEFYTLNKSITEVYTTSTSAHEDVKEEMYELFYYFSKFNNEYANIALVSTSGNEITRIDINNNAVFSDSEPINYLNSSFFSNTLVLDECSILVSVVEKPTLDTTDVHTAKSNFIILTSPIFYEGKLEAVLILNYDTNILFDSLDGTTNEYNTNVDILSDQGDLISSTSDYTTYGYQNTTSFSKAYPQEWSLLVRTPSNQIGQSLTENGLFTYTKLDLPKLTSVNAPDDLEIIFESPNIYLVTATLETEGFENIFIDSSLENFIYSLKNNFFYVGLILLISSISAMLAYYRQVSLKKIQYNSDFDSLTNTYNRRAGMQLVRNLLNSDSEDHLPLSICFLDINGLKEVNDLLGHQFGDELIATIAGTINKKIHTYDIFMRVGGDEFILVLKGTSPEEAETLWNKIMESFNFINETENRLYNISLSHGIVEYCYADDSHLDEVLIQADAKMYENKKIIKRNFNSVKNKETNTETK